MNDIVKQIYSSLNKDLSWIEKHTIFLTIHGSIAYGLNTPESDIDLRGFCTTPKEYLLGFNKNFEQYITKEPDCTIFNIKKFFALTCQNNPNTLELLFVEPEHHIFVNEIGKVLLDNRDRFLSKLVKERYIGYSKAQAHRIIQHRTWLLHPIEAMPLRKDFGLSEKIPIGKNQFDAVKSLIQKKLESWIPDFEPFSDSQKIYLQNKVSDILSEVNIYADDKYAAAARSIGLDENLIQIIKKEKEFENKVQEHKNYLSWKENRNPKRALQEAVVGYDCKHATQLIRLLILGKEILDTGKVQVKRTFDREKLMEIKTGKWSYEKLIESTDKMEFEVKESYKNSKLPNQPDIKYLDNLCIELIERNL